MSQEGLKANRKNSENVVSVSYGKETTPRITKFLSDIIKETGSNKKSSGNFLKSERKGK
jgi:hypothetical protein